MRWTMLAVLLPTLMIPLSAPAAQPGDDPLADRVKKAIDRGVQFLKDQEHGRGDWVADADAPTPGRVGGWCSLAMLALLNCGVPVDDAVVKRGLQHLRTIPPNQTYVVGLQTMVFALAGQGVDRERIQQNVSWLLSARTGNGWTYNRHENAALFLPGDNSNTQYALPS